MRVASSLFPQRIILRSGISSTTEAMVGPCRRVWFATVGAGHCREVHVVCCYQGFDTVVQQGCSKGAGRVFVQEVMASSCGLPTNSTVLPLRLGDGATVECAASAPFMSNVQVRHVRA